jgi:hypothetical protein
VVAALTAMAQASLAAQASRVVLESEREQDPVVQRVQTRLAAELRAAGFDVQERAVEAAAGSGGEGSGDEAGPFAVVRLRRAGAGAVLDVTVEDHVTHKTVVRRLDAHGRGDPSDRALALRVVELMRASLVEALVLPSEPTEPAAPAPPAPPPDVARWTRDGVQEVAPAKTTVSLALGAAATFGGPAAGTGIAPEARLAWRALDSLSIGLLAAGPSFGARVTSAEGSADVRQELALLDGQLEIALAGPLRAFADIGTGGYHLDANGQAAGPYTSGHADAWSALLAAGLGLRARLAGPASVVLDLRELVALPRPVVVFAGDRVASFMSPGTLAGLFLAVEL